VLATVLAFGVATVLAREVILVAAIPSGVITTIFAEKYGVLTASSTTLRATRILSFVTIPVVNCAGQAALASRRSPTRPT
jgi:hypothetical protein